MPQPVFVTGFKRSGTTLLGNIIDRHPRIAIFVESFFIPRYDYGQIPFWPLSRVENRVKLARAIAAEPAAKANRLELDESAIRSLTEADLSEIVDTMMTGWAHRRGKARWGDKSPGYISKLSVLSRMFPGARFVHIIRDGRDVWLSVRTLGWDTDPTRVAHDWTTSVSRARRFGRKIQDRYLEVRYERLIRDAEGTVREITDFLGEAYDPRMLEPGSKGPGNPALARWPGVNEPIDASNAEKWRLELEPRETALFEAHAGPLLQQLGYSLSGESLPPVAAFRTRLRVASHRARRGRQIVRRAGEMLGRALRQRLSG